MGESSCFNVEQFEGVSGGNPDLVPVCVLDEKFDIELSGVGPVSVDLEFPSVVAAQTVLGPEPHVAFPVLHYAADAVFREPVPHVVAPAWNRCRDGVRETSREEEDRRYCSVYSVRVAHVMESVCESNNIEVYANLIIKSVPIDKESV